MLKEMQIVKKNSRETKQAYLTNHSWENIIKPITLINDKNRKRDNMIKNESDLINNLSKNVKKLMTEQKISMNELAKRTGLTFSEIRNIRDGKIKKLNTQNIYILVDYFHIFPEQLLGTDSIPEELHITEEYVEFITSFFEKEAGDFIYYNNCKFLKDYDPQYEECVVNAIHSFIEAHKLATGYYYETIDSAKTQSLTEDSIKEKYLEYRKYQFFNSLQRPSSENEEMDGTHVKDEGVNTVDKISATGMAIKKLRELYGLTRKELGLRTRLGEDCIYRIESGINKKINYGHINLIARELLCTSDFLLGESCDPTSNREGASLFYHAENGLEFRHVHLGHDLAYAWTYMDPASKDMVINMIHTLNFMHDYKKSSEDSFGKRLSIQDVFFREQALYKERYKNRGAHFYTKKYKMDKDERR